MSPEVGTRINEVETMAKNKGGGSNLKTSTLYILRF